jgi:CubicO group peptidase (beta-lactamase class C family)
MKRTFSILILALVCLSACTGTRESPTVLDISPENPTGTAAWPTQGWISASPESQGLDAEKLDEMLAYIAAQESLYIQSVLVIRNGYLVLEQYYPPFTQETPHVLYSVTKSFVATLVGIAIEEGYIAGVDQPVLSFFPEQEFANSSASKDAMTLEDVLSMRTGLDWQEGMPAFRELVSAPDALAFMLNLEMAAQPGDQFNYCSGCSHILAAILEQTTGMDPREYAQTRLFEPLGISNLIWESDRSGLSLGGWGLYLTPRDMAKLGYLYLHNGQWDGQQIVPESWVLAATTSDWQSPTGLDYGYQWWIFPELNMYAAQGMAGQKIYVLPDLDMVVVFTADLQNADIELDLLETWILPAIY